MSSAVPPSSVAEQVKQFYAASSSAAMTRARRRPFLGLLELLEYQQVLLQAYCTAKHLYYLEHDSGNANYFLEISLNEFKEVDWKNPEIVLMRKFESKSVTFQDMLAFHNRWSSNIQHEYERVELESLYNSEAMSTFKRIQWPLYHNWVEILFATETFVVLFQQAAKLAISIDGEIMNLYNEEGELLKDYSNNCSSPYYS